MAAVLTSMMSPLCFFLFRRHRHILKSARRNARRTHLVCLIPIASSPHGRKTVIAPQALDGEITGAQEPVQSAILQALARGFSWANILESGQIKSISELARTLDVDGSYVARILKLTTLAPDIVEALINGEEPNGLSLAKLTQTFPEDWAEQRRQFGFATD